MDPVIAALVSQLQRSPGRGLWVVDENLGGGRLPAPREGLRVLTNRFDLQQQFRQAGWEVGFSDFDFAPWRAAAEGGLDVIFYRVSKEKPVVHHVINQAWHCLRPGGRLWLCGYKQEGTKTYYDKARKLYGSGELEKLGKGGFLGCLTREASAAGDWLDDRDYPALREVAGEAGLHFFSKPGVFGWDKIDQGSRFLIEEAEQRWPSDAARVLDLGCGYGYLAAHAHRLGAGALIATDNNAAALAACHYNLARLEAPAQVLPADCADQVEGCFDLILCNPPFHQGFAVEGELTDRFLQAARRLLAPGGQALFVVNRFIPLERKAAGLFGQVAVFADNDSFKLVRLAAALP